MGVQTGNPTWVDYPSTTTPVSAAALNAIEGALDDLAIAIGDAGLSAYEIAVLEGYVGDVTAWLASLHGATGESAYQAALDGGFVGTEAAWLASLQGADGVGESAYEAAVAGGFVGTEAEWLTSLEGAAGDDGLPYEVLTFTAYAALTPVTGVLYLIVGD